MSMNDELMSDTELVYLSVIMQLVGECKPDLSQLSPSVRMFITGATESKFETVDPDESDEVTKRLYFYANEVLDFDKEKLN
jgi:predicted ATP-dependent protease